MTLTGLTGFSGRSLPFLLPSPVRKTSSQVRTNELLSPLTHSFIHSEVTHLHNHSKKKKPNTGWVTTVCQSHMLGDNPEFLDLGLKPGQAWRAKGPQLHSPAAPDRPLLHPAGIRSSDVKLIRERPQSPGENRGA